MKGLLKNNALEFILFLILISISCFFIFTYPKHGIHLYLNQYVGNSLVDGFFYYITYLGDGTVAVLLLLIILLYNLRLGLYATTTFLTASLFSITLKQLFFDDENRPFFIFSYIDKHTLKLVDGVSMYIHNSFPSGHATQAFSIFMCLVFTGRNQTYKLLFFFLAIFTSLSRVYLSQHWLADITAGSTIGFGFSVLFYFVFMRNDKFRKLNRPAFGLKKGE